LLGAAVGLALAALGLLEDRREARVLPEGAAARVGERTIRVIDYQRVLAGVENDLRSPIDEAMRRRVLDRMIDEELLVQRALTLGLAAIDRRVRGDLTSGLIDSIVSDADAEEPNEDEVRRHFEENVDFFTRPGRIRAQTIFFSSRKDDERGTAATRAIEARTRLAAGAPVAEVEAALADPQVSPVPNALLPASKVRDYAGPTVLQTIERLEVGAWSEPIESGSGFSLARAVERDGAIVPPFEEVAELVRQDLKRRRGDEALRRYLDELRGEIEVEVDESIFEEPGADA
jgi:parvulin-like peptidyl-prolyl isomerase